MARRPPHLFSEMENVSEADKATASGGQDASLRMGRPFKDPGDRSRSIMGATEHAGIFITAACPSGSTLPRHRSQIASVTQEPLMI